MAVANWTYLIRVRGFVHFNTERISCRISGYRFETFKLAGHLRSMDGGFHGSTLSIDWKTGILTPCLGRWIVTMAHQSIGSGPPVQRNVDLLYRLIFHSLPSISLQF